MLLSVPTVQTTGINWMSFIPLVATIVTCFIGVAVYGENRQAKRQNEMKSEITESVGHLSDVLLERLETKENVSKLNERLARIEERLRISGSGT